MNDSAMRVFIATGFLGIVMFLGGCSSTGRKQITQPLESPILTDSTVALSVQAKDGIDADEEEITEAIQILSARLSDRLVSEGIFRQVVQHGESADYRMDVQLIGVSEVSSASRILFGVMAGSNTLEVSTVVYRGNSNDPLTSFTVYGKSAAHPFSSESHMDDAFREVIDEIIPALQ